MCLHSYNRAMRKRLFVAALAPNSRFDGVVAPESSTLWRNVKLERIAHPVHQAIRDIANAIRGRIRGHSMLRLAVAALAVVFFASLAEARVVRLRVERREVVLNGRSF